MKVKLLNKSATVPSYAHKTDAGMDICTIESYELFPGERKLFSTGIAIELEDDYVAFVQPRSGLAHKFGVTVLNTPGTIDAGYRGEIMVNLINLNDMPLKIWAGDRIAQLIIQKVERPEIKVVYRLEDSDRADRGHGSTGINANR